MPTIELLSVDWDDPRRSQVRRTLPSNSSSPTDLNQTAARVLAETPSCDGYWVKDDAGEVFITYYQRKL
jgi:hypothetical protein